LAVKVETLGLDCHRCSEAQKVERGCVEDSPIPDKWQIDDWKFRRCPIKLITQQSYKYIEVYELYEKGVMPYGDGWLQHSTKFIDAMKIIQREVFKIGKENARKRR